jgi:hypothetical protein
MKVLVSTTETQGRRKNDFCFVPEGELVKFGSECDGEKIDGSCGCRRAMCGLETHKATTTMKVEEREMTAEEFENAVYDSLKSAGWVRDEDEGREWAKEEADELQRLADFFRVGDILEKRGNKFKVRVQGGE